MQSGEAVDMHALPTSAQEVFSVNYKPLNVKQKKRGKVWHVCEAKDITVHASHFGNKLPNFLDKKHTARTEVSLTNNVMKCMKMMLTLKCNIYRQVNRYEYSI